MTGVYIVFYALWHRRTVLEVAPQWVLAMRQVGSRRCWGLCSNRRFAVFHTVLQELRDSYGRTPLTVAGYGGPDLHFD